MPIAEWGDESTIGVEPFDRDHRRLFSLATKLHSALETGAPTEVLRRLVAGLCIYMNFHFADEEALFRRTNYPDYEAHQEEHRALAASLDKIRLEFEKCPSEALVGQFLKFLKNWYDEHDQGADRAFVEYLKANWNTLELRASSADEIPAQ